MDYRKTPPYLMYFDDNPKTPPAQRLADAAAAYTRRFGCAPTLCLVSDAAMPLEAAGLEVRGKSDVRPDTYWMGQREASK